MMQKKRLKPQHRLFADKYIELGSIEQAAIQAGYKQSYAKARAYKLLDNVGIKEYIDQKMQEISGPTIASAEEVMAFLTSSMRGEVKDQFGLDPTLSDRLDAAKQLQKRYGLDKVAVVGGKDDDNPIKTESAVQIYLPDNGRDDVDT